MTEEEKILIKRLGYIKEGYIENGYMNIGSFEDINKAINLIKSKQSELEKKDKMINEMTKFITDLKVAHFKKEEGGELLGKYRCYNEAEWKQYFERKVK